MPYVNIVFENIEIGGPDTEGARLMNSTKEFGSRRIITLVTQDIKPRVLESVPSKE